jgi:hypothetical protein
MCCKIFSLEMKEIMDTGFNSGLHLTQWFETLPVPTCSGRIRRELREIDHLEDLDIMRE